MMELGPIKVTVDGEPARKQTREIEKSLKQVGVEGAVAGSRAAAGMTVLAAGARSAHGALLRLAAAVGGVTAVVATFARSVRAAEEQEVAFRRINATLRATGNVYGWTAAELAAMAGEMQKTIGVGDDVVNQAQALLLTFKSISRETFPEVLRVSADLAEAMGMDLVSAARMLGRALEDPTYGVTQLQRAGVVLTETQRAMLKEMVDAGNVTGAHAMLLDELRKRFGGLAEEANRGTGPALNVLKLAISELLEAFGTGVIGTASLEDSIRKLADFILSDRVMNAAVGFGARFREVMAEAAAAAVMSYRDIANAWDDLRAFGVSLIADLEFGWKTLWIAVSNGWDVAWQALKVGVRFAAGYVVEQLTTAADVVAAAFEKLARKLGADWLGDALAGLRTYVEELRRTHGLAAQMAAAAAGAPDYMSKLMQADLERRQTQMAALEETMQRRAERNMRVDALVRRFTDIAAGTVRSPVDEVVAPRPVEREAEGRAMRLLDLLRTIQRERRAAFAELKFDEGGLLDRDSYERFKARMQDVQALVEQVKLQVEAGMVGMNDALAAGFVDAAEKWGRLSQRVLELGSHMAETLDRSMTDALMSIVDGTATVQEAFANMANVIVQELMRVVVQLLVVRPLLQSLAGFFGLPVGMAQVAHGGGVAGAAEVVRPVPVEKFVEAPRYATGGVAANEVPIIAHRGEVVLNEEQLRALQAGRTGGTQKVEIVNVMDPTLVDERILANPGAVLNVIARNRTAVRAMLGMYR